MFKNSSGKGKLCQLVKRLWQMYWISDHRREEAVFRNSGDLCRKQISMQLVLRVHLDHTIKEFAPVPMRMIPSALSCGSW